MSPWSGFRLLNIQRILGYLNQSFKGLRMEQNGDEIVVLEHAITSFRTFREIAGKLKQIH